MALNLGYTHVTQMCNVHVCMPQSTSDLHLSLISAEAARMLGVRLIYNAAKRAGPPCSPILTQQLSLTPQIHSYSE
ncbi:hypothetical protein FKM82_024254 [Ascaphus truei]